MASYDSYSVGPALKSSCGSSRQRHFYDEVQLALLDAEFTRDSFPNREGRRRIAQLIGVSEKSIMWWFQNRRRRARQIGSKSVTSTRETNRQHRRTSPYASHQRQQDSYISPHSLQTPGFFSDPVVPVQEEQQINFSSSESSTLSSPQFDWVASPCQQDIYQHHNFSYSTKFLPSDQPQQQDYSLYWNNWQYSPPFYPTSVTNQNVYPNSVSNPYDYSSSNSYYSPESNQYYCQSYM